MSTELNVFEELNRVAERMMVAECDKIRAVLEHEEQIRADKAASIPLPAHDATSAARAFVRASDDLSIAEAHLATATQEVARATVEFAEAGRELREIMMESK